MKKYFSNMLMVIISTILALLIGELILRLADFEPRKFLKKSRIEGGIIFRGSSVTEYEIPVVYNKFSFRERNFECVNKPKNVYRIIVLGDSYTEALQVNQEKTFHKIVERRINDEYGSTKVRYEVLNFARSGSGQLDMEKILRINALRCKPDLVLEEFNSTNDLGDNSQVLKNRRTKQYNEFRKRKYSREQMNKALILFDGSMLNHLAAQAISDIYTDCPIFCNYTPIDWIFFTDSTDKEHDKAWAITKKSILNQHKLIKESGAIFAFWLKDTHLRHLDWKTKLKYNYDDYNWDVDKPARIISSFLSEHGLPYVDVTPSIEAYRSVHGYNSVRFKYDAHWNEKGHEIAADVIFKFLVNEKLI